MPYNGFVSKIERVPSGVVIDFPPGKYPGISDLARANFKNEQGTAKEPTDLTYIQRLLAAETRHVLPDELIEQLHFTSLKWARFAIPGLLPDFFAGFPQGINLDDLGDFQAALATIEVERGVGNREKVTVQDIRMAAVALDSNKQLRVAAMSYYPKEGNVYWLGLSVSPQEYQETVTYGSRASGQLTSEMDSPHATPGFTTQAMAEQTGHPLLIYAYSASHNLNMRIGESSHPERYGLSVVHQDGHAGIKQNYQGHKWQLLVPEYLQAVQNPPVS